MKYISTVILVALLAVAANAFACTGFYKGESVDGMSKICYYDHLGSTAAMTISSVSVCPVSMEFSH